MVFHLRYHCCFNLIFKDCVCAAFLLAVNWPGIWTYCRAVVWMCGDEYISVSAKQSTSSLVMSVSYPITMTSSSQHKSTRGWPDVTEVVVAWRVEVVLGLFQEKGLLPYRGLLTGVGESSDGLDEDGDPSVLDVSGEKGMSVVASLSSESLQSFSFVRRYRGYEDPVNSLL